MKSLSGSWEQHIFFQLEDFSELSTFWTRPVIMSMNSWWKMLGGELFPKAAVDLIPQNAESQWKVNTTVSLEWEHMFLMSTTGWQYLLHRMTPKVSRDICRKEDEVSYGSWVPAQPSAVDGVRPPCPQNQTVAPRSLLQILEKGQIWLEMVGQIRMRGRSCSGTVIPPAQADQFT